MISLKENKTLFIRPQTLLTLYLIKNNLLSSCNKLLTKDQAIQAIKTGYLDNEPMPYPYIFAPYGKQNQQTISSCKIGEKITILCGTDIVGHIFVQSVFKFEPEWINKNIFGYQGEDGKPLYGEFAISGDIEIYIDPILKAKNQIEKIKNQPHVKTITALTITADPFHRAHERLVRMTIDKADAIIIFLKHTQSENGIDFELRKKTLEFFIQSYLPAGKAVIVPLKDAQLLNMEAGPVIECIIAKRIGATKIVLGQHHTGVGMFYDNDGAHTILDPYKNDLKLDIVILPELVYCNKCRTIVSTKTCPHGQHHHIKYHSQTIKALLFTGILPPAILIRPEISAIILSEIFKNRFNDIQRICDELFPNSGLIESRTERDFYEELMRLYQTGSLT